METQGIKEGDLISFYTCCNADRKLLRGTVEFKEQLGFIVFVNGIQYELRKLIDIKVSRNVKKTFYRMDNIGKAKYTISFHDGIQTHNDGSPFYGIAIFKSKKKLQEFTSALIAEGYTSE